MSSPPLNYTLSPYTGWTREHWEMVLARLTYGYALAAERHGSPARALYPDDRCDRPDSVDALESAARIALIWGTWLRNPANPASLLYQDREMNLESLMRQALLDGTDPKNPRTYWGDIGHMDQRIVEAANLSVALWLSRERVFARMSEAERAQVIGWLAQVDGKETYPDNWILFPAMSLAVRLHLGYPASEAELDARLGQIAALYRGDGWYADGAGSEFDLYNAWLFGCHYLLWAWIDGDRRPDLRRPVLERARSFLAGFQFFFGANGAYPAWGRSLVSRFAAVVAFQTGYLLKVAPPHPGRLRRLCSGCLRYFYEHGMFDPEGHFIRQGYHDDFPSAGEGYISPGTPTSACNGLLALTFDRNDPFWTEVEAPLPVECEDFDLALPVPGFALSGRRATGQVTLLNSRSGHEPDTARNNYAPKYGKFAYATRFPFNAAPAAGSYAPDAMIALTSEGRAFGHRGTTRDGAAAPRMIWSEFDEMVGGQPQFLRVAVLLWRDFQVRLAFVRPTLPVRAFESPGALGCDGAAQVTRKSDPSAGWEYAEAEGRALGICRLWGYDSQCASAPFLGYSNINLAYPYSEQPTVCETQLSAAARGLAALSLLRPAPFDPAREFPGFSVAAETAGMFRVTFPDGECALVALQDDPPHPLRLSGIEVEGATLRCVRVKPGASEVCGMGLVRIAGVAELSAPAVLWLRHEGSGVARVTTDAGLSLSEAWLGGALRRIEARTLDDEWAEVAGPVKGNTISPEMVREWSQRNERQLVEFRLSIH